jgi:hypothetical protein
MGGVHEWFVSAALAAVVAPHAHVASNPSLAISHNLLPPSPHDPIVLDTYTHTHHAKHDAASAGASTAVSRLLSGVSTAVSRLLT